MAMKTYAALMIIIGMVAILIGLNMDRSKGLANLPIIVILILIGAAFLGVGLAMIIVAIWLSI